MKSTLFSLIIPCLFLATLFLPQPAPGQTLPGSKPVAQSGDSVTDATLETAYSEAIGSEDTRYHFRRHGSGYTAYNAAHDLAMDATPQTVTFSFSDETWQLASGIPAAEITIHENRLTIQRNGYEEWYVNGPMGLQQGFTLDEPTNISFDLGGTLATTASRQTLHLGDKLTFAGLMAYDANGQSVPVEFKVEDKRLVYKYDDTAAAYPITIDPWLQQATLNASDAAADANFGFSVALDGETALVGAIGDKDDNGFQPGSAYVFVRSGTTWTQQAKLVPDTIYPVRFGWSVALDGDTALVGADLDENLIGSVYVFVRSGTTWTQQAKLTAGDPGMWDYFGSSVALDGNTALIGAYGNDDLGFESGSVYVFVRSGTTWTQQAKLLPADGESGDTFGFSVILDGDTAFISAPYYHDGPAVPPGVPPGGVHVFVRSGTTWTQQTKLLASDGANEDFFGISMALEADTIVIGAPGDDDNGFGSGSAYVFVRSGTTWTQQTKLLPADGEALSGFGAFAAVSGDTAFIGGAAYSPEGIYVFTRTGTTWTEQGHLGVNGRSLALSSDTLLVGNSLDDDFGADSGSAYVFTFTPNHVLTVSAACNGPDLDVMISDGDGPFDITASAGINTPITGVSSGTTVINGPEKWDDITVTETNGDFESINLGQFKCRTDERPIPISPGHRSRITDPYPLFSWTAISNANNYRVFLFDDASAATRTVDIRQNSGGPTSMTLNTALPDGRLFWRVRGRQNRVWSLWSIRFTLFKDPVVPLSVTTPMPTIELAPPNRLPTQVPLPTPAPGDDPTLPAPPNSR